MSTPESMPPEPTPTDPTPGEPAPGEPTPTERIPTDPTPGEGTPGEPAQVEPTPGEPTRPRHAGTPGLVAAAIIGLQALGCVVFAVLLLFAAPKSASLSHTSQVMLSVFTFLFAVGLGLVARGLLQGKSWPRTATVVWLVLLLPVGWAMVQAGRGLVGVLILGSAVVGIGAAGAESRSAARP